MKKTVLLLGVLALAGAALAQSVQRQALFTISGRVVDRDGRPVPDARVTGAPDLLSGKAPTAITDIEGKFTLDAYKGGRWTVTVEKLSDGYASTYHPFFYPDQKFRPEVLIQEGKPIPFVTVRLPEKIGFLRLHVTGETNQKVVTAVRIRLCRIETPNYCYTVDRSGTAGMHTIPAVPSPFTVSVSADGYDDWLEFMRSGVSSGAARDISVPMKRNSAAGSESLPAPLVISPPDGTELFNTPRSVRLEWAPVPGAVSYGVEVDGCDQIRWTQPNCPISYPLQHYRNSPTAGIVGTTYEFSFIGAQQGRWRVWAFDSEGRPGKKTGWQVFLYRL